MKSFPIEVKRNILSFLKHPGSLYLAIYTLELKEYYGKQMKCKYCNNNSSYIVVGKLGRNCKRCPDKSYCKAYSLCNKCVGIDNYDNMRNTIYFIGGGIICKYCKSRGCYARTYHQYIYDMENKLIA